MESVPPLIPKNFGDKELEDSYLILYPVVAQRTTKPHKTGGALDMQKRPAIKALP